jgi:flagellar biosynthesis/type III secretory pathway M-ring protein FliF/YscJ
MSTCANEATNGRTVVVARVLEQVPEDTFLDWPNTGTGIDIQWTLFGIVWYVWAFGLIVILSAVGLILTAPYSKKNRKKEQAAKEARKAERRQAETDISSAILHNNEDLDKLKAELGDNAPPDTASGSGAETSPSEA